MSEEELPRPYCCPEPSCTPLHQLGEVNADSTGETFSCWGRMARLVEFVYDGVEHSNDLNHCDYTALKGILRYQENADDWRALRNFNTLLPTFTMFLRCVPTSPRLEIP